MPGEGKTNLPQQLPAPLAASWGGSGWWQQGWQVALLLATSSRSPCLPLTREGHWCCLAATTGQAHSKFGVGGQLGSNFLSLAEAHP